MFKKCRAEVAIGKQRIGALNKLFAYRYGGAHEWIFPEDDAGLEDLKILIHHYAWTNPLAIPRVIQLRALWADAEAIMNEVEAYPRKWRSETLGKILNFTGKEWRQLRIRTIAPVDMSSAERRYYSRIIANGRRLKKRRMQGMKTRTEYEANSLSRSRPWLDEGISRSTWERRRRRDASMAAIKITKQEPDLRQTVALGEVRDCSPTSKPASPDLRQFEISLFTPAEIDELQAEHPGIEDVAKELRERADIIRRLASPSPFRREKRNPMGLMAAARRVLGALCKPPNIEITERRMRA